MKDAVRILATVISAAAIVAAIGAVTQPAHTTTADLPAGSCVIDAASVWEREAARHWCARGLFSRVVMTTDPTALIATLHLSGSGQRSWEMDRDSVMSALRAMTVQITPGADANVSLSVHGADGAVVGACVQRRTEHEATCRP